MPAKRVALIAYHFPPENAAGAARPFRFYRYLPELGIERRVFTAAAPGPNPLPDVEHVPDALGQFWEGRGEKPEGAWTARAELFFRRFIVPAGVGFTWSRDVAAACERLAAQHPQDRLTIFATFPPVGCHLAALRLRRKGIRIVADYRDPFSLSPDKMETGNPWVKWLDRRTMKAADLVIANSDAAAAAFREAFPAQAQKVHAIWNGFDPQESVEALPIPSRAAPVLAHVGAIYGGRSPDAILESVGRMHAAGFAGAPSVSLVGPLGYGASIDATLIERGRSGGWLEFVPERIPQADARRLAAEADLLLLLQPQSSVQVPAKLFEYIRIGRPILAYAPKGSAIEWLLERSGIPFQCVYPEDAPADVDAKIRALLAAGRGPHPASVWFLESFDARRQTAHLAGLIDQLDH